MNFIKILSLLCLIAFASGTDNAIQNKFEDKCQQFVTIMETFFKNQSNLLLGSIIFPDPDTTSIDAIQSGYQNVSAMFDMVASIYKECGDNLNGLAEHLSKSIATDQINQLKNVLQKIATLDYDSGNAIQAKADIYANISKKINTETTNTTTDSFSFPSNVMYSFWTVSALEAKANLGLSSALSEATVLIGDIGQQIGLNSTTLNNSVITPLNQMANIFKRVGNAMKVVGHNVNQVYGLTLPNPTENCITIRISNFVSTVNKAISDAETTVNIYQGI